MRDVWASECGDGEGENSGEGVGCQKAKYVHAAPGAPIRRVSVDLPISINGRVSVYGPTFENVILNVNNQPFTERVPTAAIFDLDIGYNVTKYIKLDLGANNIFNTLPPKAPLVGGLPVDNGVVYSVPYSFSPYGINGGYYYGRVGVTF